MSAPAARSHDFVIVGAGSAGCVLASRLSADPSVRVLLLEAGPRDRRREIAIPAAFPMLMRSEVDWNYTTTPQPGLVGRSIYQPRGKTLGGSSSLNAQIYQRGHAADFDGWAAAGASGWGAADVLPYFRRAERAEGLGGSVKSAAGLSVDDLRHPNEMTRAFLAAAREVGIEHPATTMDGGQFDGAAIPRLTQKRGRRWSTADAYLRPALRRPNLTVATGALVTRVVLEGDRATGVEYRQDGATRTARAEREVILCGGAFNSPQLLLLSGIGAGEQLSALGIAVRHELPGVGRNLQDHPMAGLRYACRQPVSLLTAASLPNLLRYLLFRDGPLTSNIAEGLAFVRTRPELAAPDLELIFAPVYYDVLAPPTVHGLSIGVVALQPRSVGSVRLASAEPADPPLIDPCYLTDRDDQDLRVLVAGTRLAHLVLHARALSTYLGEPLAAPERIDDDEAVASFVRGIVETVYHPVGTCRMGTDAQAVVDPQLRVRGVAGLRVADAAVMPSIVRGHTNAAVVMIAERAADLVRGVA